MYILKKIHLKNKYYNKFNFYLNLILHIFSSIQTQLFSAVSVSTTLLFYSYFPLSSLPPVTPDNYPIITRLPRSKISKIPHQLSNHIFTRFIRKYPLILSHKVNLIFFRKLFSEISKLIGLP